MNILTSQPMHRTSSQRYESFIAEMTVAHVLDEVKPSSSRDLIDMPVTASVEEALDTFLAKEILSVPVYTMENNIKSYKTILGVLDLLRFLNQGASSETLLQPLSEAIGMTTESSRLCTVQPTDSLRSLLLLFRPGCVHRVLVQTDGGHPVLLSQTDVVRFLQSHNHQLGHILDLSVPSIVASKSVWHSREGVRAVSFKSTAMDAFKMMAEDPSISRLAVVDDNGSLVTDIGPEDLRGLNRDRYALLQTPTPILAYLRACRGEIYSPPTCHEQFTLSQVMSAMLFRGINRLWWCDNDDTVKGVITLSDVIGFFV